MKKLGQLSPAPFLKHPDIVRLFQVLDNRCMFVGGCVRDNILLPNKVCFDIDIASEILPHEAMASLEKKGFKVVPIGLKHGSFSVISDPYKMDITTLRADMKTDGRHAEVGFSSDWEEDAKRRDFTINALYADIDGNVYDFFDGAAFEDIARRKVRFIGFAEERINEDYLRILRFFRFYTYYGAPPPDKDALGACRRNAGKIKRLSAERVREEFLKILLADNVETAIALMHSCNILQQITDAPINIDYLRQTEWLETRGIIFDKVKPSIPRRIIALLNGDKKVIIELAEYLKLPNKLKQEMEDTLNTSYEDNFKALKFLMGENIALNVILLHWAKERHENPRIDSEASLRKIRALEEFFRFTPLPLPISGEDLKLAGIPTGPEYKKLLEEAKQLFIQNGFTDNKDSLLKKLQLP